MRKWTQVGCAKDLKEKNTRRGRYRTVNTMAGARYTVTPESVNMLCRLRLEGLREIKALTWLLIMSSCQPFYLKCQWLRWLDGAINR